MGRKNKLFNIVRTAIILLLCEVSVVFSVQAQQTTTSSVRQIVCGNNLCTIGDPGNGGHERVCWEITKKQGKCKYVCQGAEQEKPKDCKKKACKKVTVSSAGCTKVNNGNPMPDNFQDRPEEYKKYYEATYSNDEMSTIKACPNDGGVSRGTCKCGTGRGQIVCGANKICMEETTTQTDMGQGYSRISRYLCQNPPSDASDQAGSDVANPGTTFNNYGGVTTTSYADSSDCPLVSQYQEKWSSGCWTCLVVEKLTSAFLKVASIGIGVSEKAGKTLLLWGFAIWLCIWALKSVSSFTEVKGGNTLNDLLRMGGKIVIAYLCINMGIPTIRNFIITPIMGIGSTIAQNFWSDTKSGYNQSSMKDYMEDFVWDDAGSVDGTEAYEAAQNEEVTSTPVMSEEVSEHRSEVAEIDEEIGAEMEIPPFQVPGTNGVLTSFPGCRVPPPTGSSNGVYTRCGSFAHMGLDVGANAGSKIWAMAGGKITYTEISGYGKVAIITTVHKGNTWQHLYAHMNCQDWNNYKSRLQNQQVQRGDIIGGVGGTCNPGSCDRVYANHLHVEVTLTGNVGGTRYQQAVLDPVSLGEGKIVVRGHKNGTIAGSTITAECKCPDKGPCNIHRSWHSNSELVSAERNMNRSCRGFALSDPNTSVQRGQRFPIGGITSPGVAKVEASDIVSGEIGLSSGNADYSTVVKIADVKYSGPTDIMPKSVMNSMLGATKAITDTTAQMMVLGNMAMCYSTVEDGGAWSIAKLVTITNVFMWLDGAIIFVLGFVLTCVVGYYLVDISFKIGFAVLALPIVMGLWPFGVTKGKLAEIISIIAKSAALFAFLALTSYYGIELIVASLGGADGAEGMYAEFDAVVSNSLEEDQRDTAVEHLNEAFGLFSSSFLLMLFGCIYTFKLIKETTKDLVEKFYPDNAFGSQNPMHKGMTSIASMANKLNQKWGTGLAKDLAARGVGNMGKKALSKAKTGAVMGGRAVSGGMRKVLSKPAAKVAGAARNLKNKLTGGK